MTANEIFALFSNKSSVVDSDRFMVKSVETGSTQAVFITADVLKAYLGTGLVSVSQNGTWIINGTDTQIPVAGVSPQLRAGTTGLEVSYDNGTTWSTLVLYSRINQGTLLEISEEQFNAIFN